MLFDYLFSPTNLNNTFFTGFECAEETILTDGLLNNNFLDLNWLTRSCSFLRRAISRYNDCLYSSFVSGFRTSCGVY